MPAIRFKYRNHRGEVADRTIDFESVEWLAHPGFGYQPGWFITGRCHEKDARRSFALTAIVLSEGIRHVYKLSEKDPT